MGHYGDTPMRYIALLLILGQAIASGGHRKIFASSACTANSFWQMTEGTGLTLNDISGNSNTATINTGASVAWTANDLVSGKTTPVWQGTGFALATSTTLNNFDGAHPLSIVSWFKTSNNAEQALMGNLNATGGTFQGWEMNLGFTGTFLIPQFFLINTYPSNAIAVNSSATISLGSVHMLAMTYDPTVSGGGCTTKCAAGVSIYLDGVLQTPVVTQDSLTGSAASGLPTRFGARNDGSDEFAGGDAFAGTYPCILTSTQITACNVAGPSRC